MTLSLAITFVLYTLLVQKLVRWSDQVPSRGFRTFLNIYFLLSFVGGIAFLIYFGWTTVWYYPLLFFLGGGIVAAALGGILDRIVGHTPMGLISLIGVPVGGFFLFRMVI